MGLEQALGVRLTLVAQMGNAAQELRGELNAVAKSLKVVRDLGKTFTLDGLTQLNKEVTSLNQRAGAAAEKVAVLSQHLGTVNGNGKAAAAGIGEAAVAADRVKTSVNGAAASVIKMGDALTRTKETGSALATLHTDFVLVEQAAGAATSRVNAFADAVLRLAGAQRLALPGGSNRVVDPYYAGPSAPAPPRALPSAAWYDVAGPASAYAISGARQFALPSGDGPRYGPIPQPASRRMGGEIPLGPGQVYMLPPGGSTGPSWANEGRPGVFAEPPAGGGGGGGGFWGGIGDFFNGGGGGMKKFGDHMQSQGWALAVNGGMLSAALVPAIKNAMDIDDLLHRTYEALKAGGATEAAAKQFSDATRAIPREVGSDYRETVSAGYNFISAMPAGLNLNDPKVMQAVVEGYKRTAMMVVAGSSSTHQVSMEEGALDVNNVIANLGLDTSTPAKLAQAYKTATNLLINLKNRTSTEVDMAAQSIKGIGPIAKEMNVDPAEIVALIGMEAEGKVRGATAGYAIKRLLQRQSVPSKKTENLINLVNSMGGNIALFDKDGKTRSLLDVMADTTKFEDTHHLSDQNRAMIQGQLAGLYAVGNLDLMQDQIRKHGGAEGARKYGKSLINGTIAGGKTGDATKDTYHARAANNPLVASHKVGADFLDSMYRTFKEIQPFLMGFLKNIDGLVKAFDALPKPVRDGLAEFAIMTAAFSVLAGGSAILLGNFIKFGGAVKDIVKGGITFVGWLNKVGAIEKIGGLFGKASDIIGGVFMRSLTLAGTAIEFLGATIYATPIIGWIAALVAAGVLLYEGWTHDWGGIREKTAAVWGWISDMFQKFPQVIIGVLGPVGVALELIFNKNFRDAAVKGIKAVGDGFRSGVSWAVGGIEYIWSAIWKAISSWGAQALHAGEAFVGKLGEGIQNGIKAAPTLIKGGLQKIRDLFNGSEPKDSSSPLYGMGKSGQAFSDMFINGVLDGFRNGKAKVKKAAKAVSDVLVDLRGESVSEVEKTAHAIEAVLSRQGAIIKNKWMDLLTGGHVTRFYGDTQAVRMAIKQDKGPDPLKEASDYLRRLGEYPQTYQQIMSRLHTWLKAANAAELQHEVSMIDALIAHVQKAHDSALAKLSVPFTGRNGTSGFFGQIEKTFTSESDKGNAFDALQQKDDAKLQRMIELRKNQELPTLAELRKEREFEITERDALRKAYDKEIEQRPTLIAEITNALQKAQEINATDKQSQDLKAKLLAQAQAFADELDTLNGRLEDQEIALTKLNGTIDQYTTEIKGATNASQQWAAILSDSFTQAGNDALKSLGDSLSNGLDQMLSRVFGAKRKGIAGVVGSFFAEAFSNVFNTLIGSAEKELSTQMTGGIMGFFSRLFNVGGGNSTSAAPPTSPLQSAYDALKTIPGMPQQVQLTDSSGNDLSIPIAQGVQQTAQGVGAVATATTTVANAAKAQAANSDQSATDPIDAMMKKFLKSNVGKSLVGIAGAYAGYEEATAPGATPVNKVMGALSTYASISSMPGGETPVGQGVAIAASLYTLFSHSDDPSKMPDKYNTQAYGSAIANLLGSGYNGANPMHANGQSFTEDPALEQQLGGGELAYISAWIKANPTQAAKVLGQANASLLAGATSITGGHDGNLTLNNGQTVNWQTLVNAANQATSAIQQFGTNALSASQDAARLAASFTSLILGGPAGFNIPLLLGGLGGTISSSSTALSSNAPLRNGTPAQAPIHVNILQGATISKDIAGEVEAALPQLASTITSIVNRANYQQQRLYGDYVSAVG